MSLLARAAFVGARGIDTITPLTAESAAALKAGGVDFAVRYIHSLTPGEAETITSAGLALMLVCYADRFNGPDTVAELHRLGIPTPCTVWADLESDHDSASTVSSSINAWANAVKIAGYDAGLYVGCDQPLDAAALYQLMTDRYWRSASWVPEPQCGYTMYQLRGASNVVRDGVLVDVDIIEQDKRGRVPTWTIAA